VRRAASLRAVLPRLAAVLTLGLAPAAPAAAQEPVPNPCLEPGMRCPDLVMAPPSQLDADASPSGRRVVLRQENRIVNIGRGPAELFGTRRDYTYMDAEQVIADAAGVRRRYATGAVLEYTSVPTRGGDYWKMEQAARFELWRVDGEGRRTELVQVGPKLNYCLRDLERVRSGSLVPRRFVFPACNQSASARNVTLGTSVGWADVYPETYPGNWIDVTGRRGCFALVHRADPLNRLLELREDNNVASRIVRLPYRAGPQRCP
jgi:hypothetical protein